MSSNRSLDVFLTPQKKRSLVFSTSLLVLFVAVLAVFDHHHGDVFSTRQLITRVHNAGRDIGWTHLPALFAVGIVAGMIGGMIGMGGGVLKIAGMLLLLKLDFLFARSVSLATLFFTTASAAFTYYQKGMIEKQAVYHMVFPAILFTIGGVVIGNSLRGATLTYLFGFFIIFMGLNTLSQIFSDPTESNLDKDGEGESKGQKKSLYSIGAIHGFLCGLLGISGGVASLPMQQIICNKKMRQAVANTVTVSALCTGIGCVLSIWTGVDNQSFKLDDILFVIFCIGIGAAIGGQIGSRLGEKVPSVFLRIVFVLIVFLGGVSILI